MLENGRTDTDRVFKTIDVVGLGNDKMAKLVGRDKDSEHDDHDDYGDENLHAQLTPFSYVARTYSRTSLSILTKVVRVGFIILAK